jgi:hypothetical protein
MKQEITVYLVNEYWWEDEIERNLVDFVDWAKGLLESIPDEFKDLAQVSVGSDSESSAVHFMVWYNRFETDDEEAQREAQSRAYQERQEAEDRARLRFLQEKYGEGSP